MIRIVVDVMGFDYDPIEAITACRHFKKFHDDVKIIFVGDKSELLKRILESELDQYEIIDAKDVVTCSDNPISYLRNKETSLFKGMKFVADDQADGFLSAGTTAAFVTIANSLIGTIDGINKAAFMSYIPTTDCRGLMLLDEGANLNCTGQDLYQFAQMANAYCRVLRNIEQPRVGLINIGTEEYKGFDFHHEANTYLRADSTINYQGFLETRNIINGTVDIAVCDGYTGNIVLKTLEGALKSINDLLKIQFKKPVN
jgi:glycerol-3-phosphate acyltransferase PlsX